jgi:hypothetical protein
MVTNTPVVFPLDDYEYGQPWWNDIDRGKLKYLERNLSHCHFVHHKTPHGLTKA